MDGPSSGCGAIIKMLVISPVFEGKSILERQRFMNTEFQPEFSNFHAVVYKRLWTPAQFEQNKDKLQNI